VGGLLALALPALAQEEPAGRSHIAAVNFAATGVEWSPTGQFAGMVLTVSGPNGVVSRQEYAAGNAPSFDIFDKRGQRLPDGVYNWELVASPIVDKETRAALRASRRSDDSSAIADLQKAGRLPRTPLVQSGSFTIANGAFVTAEGPEPTATRTPQQKKSPVSGIPLKDQVIPDDLIVQGSACIGLDCVNNESFGFDTIRLKENNTRIKFDDTSTGTGFPNHDWQLTANDSASGGANKFSIEDITAATVPFTVTGSAATNSIFVDSTGRVGFRTSTPVLDLHVATSNTPAIRLEQNNSGGFTAQTWDIAGNEANFFVRDVTGGSRLPFRIRPGAPTSSIDINASGDVGIGTASPAEKLHISASVDAASIAENQNTSSGLSANAGFRAQNDTGARTQMLMHSSTRTTSRFGKVLGGVSELLADGGNGMVIGTLEADDLILGTNNVNRLQINGSTGAVTVSGNFTVTGVKNFAMPDPANSKRAIFYASLEGPEAGTYFRGSAKMKGGEAVIELPGYFSRITEPERMTVQLTPTGSWGQMYVAEKTPTRLVVRAAPGTTDLEFDFLVQGVRKGYLDYEVERPNTLPQ
jgi:hypothetical protein